VRVTDVAGNVSMPSDEFDVAIDTSALMVSVIGFKDDVGSVTGAVDITGSDGVWRTDDTTPEMYGTSLPDAIVYVTYMDEKGNMGTFGQAVTDADGRWSIKPNNMLPEGRYEFTIEATNLAGNKTKISTALVIDTTPPSVNITDAQDDVGIIKTSIVDGGVTDDPTPTLVGTSEAWAHIRVYDEQGRLVGDVMADGNGDWNVTIDALLNDGAHKLKITATDDVGNESAPVEYNLVLDTTAPDATATITGITEDTGIEGDFITSDTTVPLWRQMSGCRSALVMIGLM